MSFHSNRRQFLQTTAVAGIGFWVAGGVQAKESKSPNEKVAIAAIGIGGKGSSDTSDAAEKGQLVAICDVDLNTLKSGKKRYPKAKEFTDFRKLLEKMGKSIDAVTVSTPDHTHAAAALMAMRMGKHCFCQKPLTHTIYEARLMAKVAREKKLATQMGNQGTSNSPLRKGAAIIKSGVLGPVSEVHVWTNRPIWPQGGARPASKPIPKHLKWELWLGPAPRRPYADGYHPSDWRGWWDFGTGALGDMACHTVNMSYMALNLRDPISVQAECSGHNRDSYPKWSIIHFEFPALGGRPALKMTWYDGGKKPDEKLIDGKRMSDSGSLIIGQKGKLYAPGDYAENELHLLGGVAMPDVKWVESPGHFDEWIRAIKGGEPAMSNFQNYAGGLTETILLGNLAVWVAASGKGEKVEWDAKNMKSTNISGLEPIIKPKYCKGYTLDV
jgi:predicted dehydrogenase